MFEWWHLFWTDAGVFGFTLLFALLGVIMLMILDALWRVRKDLDIPLSPYVPPPQTIYFKDTKPTTGGK